MIERTEDVGFLRSIATHHRVWPWMKEDGCTPESYEPLIHPSVHYLRFGDHGFFAFRMMNRVMFDSHVAMLPKTQADEAARFAIEWMWKNTEARKLVCFLPPIKRHAIRFAQRAGYEEEGRLRASFLLNDKLHDLIVLGVKKWATQ
ncbi:GNAT family N-acetyltransferase [Achromobacter insuavis]|uniref:GNAT family N-acetyltransferase n=1 Tax=Achromobacter insuavis TaxID=1287735 RepID=UPI003B9AC276